MCMGPEIMLIAASVQAVGNLMSASDTADQYNRRAGEIMASAKEEAEHTSTVQERRRGGVRAAYGKAGVKLSGTPTRYIDAQIKEDERELLLIKYNADLRAHDEIRKGQEARRKAASDFIGAMGGAAGDAYKGKAFGLGA